MTRILPFSVGTLQPRDWTNDELAELYRVETALSRANISLQTDRGLTDEGDPWFVFCRSDGEVIVHIARFDGRYHVFSPVLPEPLTGHSFTALTKAFVSGVPVAVRSSGPSPVLLHPSALLSLLVAAIYFATEQMIDGPGSAFAAPTSESKGDDQRTGEIDLFARRFVSNLVNTMTKGMGGEKADLAGLAGQAAVVLASLHLSGLFSDQPPVSDAPTMVGGRGEVVNVGAVQAGTRDDEQEAARPGGASPEIESLAIIASAPIRASDGSINVGGFKTLREPDESGRTAALDLVRRSPAADASADTLAESKVPVGLGGPSLERVALFQHHAPPSQTQSADDHVVVTLTGDEGWTDLNAVDGLRAIVISGNGGLSIEGLPVNKAPTIWLAADAVVDLCLDYAASVGGTRASQTISLGGGSELSLVGVTGLPLLDAHLNLQIDSGGNEANTLDLSESPSDVTFTITISGSEELYISERAELFQNSILDASAFTGQLTVGIDLSKSDAVTTFLGSSNLVVDEDTSFELLHVRDASVVAISISLQTLIVQVDAPSTGATSLTVALDPAADPALDLAILRTDGVRDLTIESNGPGALLNSIYGIADPSLENLTITGSNDISIEALLGITSDHSQSIIVDAHALTGSLLLDLSDVSNLDHGARSIVVAGGAGDDVLSDLNSGHVVTFTGNGGSNTFVVANGTTGATITDLKSSDTVSVAGGDLVCSVVDATSLGSIGLDQLDLQSAAESVAAEAGRDEAYQAVLFSYQEEFYIFVDSDGDHHLDSKDAVVRLVGNVMPSDLAGVFRSE